MPGPFPGMDPYLESPEYWRGFHNMLIASITGELNTSLPPGFGAFYEERVYLAPEDRSAYPDVTVRRRAPDRVREVGALATLDDAEPDGLMLAHLEETREGFVEIRAAVSRDKVITVIEVLSPANKAARSRGREEYLGKQADVLESDTSLIEIDLLRAGEHTCAPPYDLLCQRGRWDCLVSLHRGSEEPGRYWYWMNVLRKSLPPIRVPLTPGVTDVVLPLQRCFDRTYDAGPYSRLMDYRDDPPVALCAEDAAWADALLREKGLRG